jgi:phospholipid transport system substrate-binding protein
MKRIGRMGLMAVLGFFSLALAAVPQDPSELIKTTSDQVRARVVVERDTLRTDRERLHRLVDDLILPHFDFDEMSQRVLGKAWRGANSVQRERFIDEFRKLLIRTYALALLDYADREIRYFPVRTEPGARQVTVKTEIDRPGGAAMAISYRLHVTGDAWKVNDITVDGVSLVNTYQASFRSEVRKGGIDGLIDSLATKNATPPANATNPPPQ